ncbi:hypothetical protein Y032_0800g2416 [Ancylostoma ceylanicum]|uniref:Uncharacterized protein n=1 Tax=Ancylostoma ceylanicum TaxID=53326 RepID=A0A016WCI8_9BILA|nr:hypothetical protein Y032_0800g2416 [Ancylostoma ceylanicum]
MLTGASWSKISEQARNLVSRMLTVDDGERITAKEGNYFDGIPQDSITLDFHYVVHIELDAQEISKS